MLYAGLDLAKRFDFQPPTVGRLTLPVSRPPPRRSSAVALETQSRARNRQRLRLQVNREVAQRNPPRLVNECSHSAAIVSQPGDGTCSFRADDGTRTHDLLHGKEARAKNAARSRRRRLVLR